MAAYESAIVAAREWRVQVLPADAFRVGADVALAEIYSDYVEKGMSLYAARGDAALMHRMFEVAELNRAAALREQSPARAELPVHYYETLDRMRAAIAAGHPASELQAKLD
jgi:hypothetical protein